MFGPLSSSLRRSLSLASAHSEEWLQRPAPILFRRENRSPHDRRLRLLRVSLTGMPLLSHLRRVAPACALLTFALVGGTHAIAAEHVTLRTGYELFCAHHITDGTKTRLYLDTVSSNYIEVDTAAITADESVPDPPVAATGPALLKAGSEVAPRTTPATAQVLSPSELHEVLASAGQAHDLDVDLLASVVHAESGARVHARSRVGAEGLMQLMPATAADLGVHDVFAPKENVGGGAAYLDALLRRYHENVAWALAAYNAGPGAVDRYHGIPPYRETRLYVARIIHEFNRRYSDRQGAAALARAK